MQASRSHSGQSSRLAARLWVWGAICKFKSVCVHLWLSQSLFLRRLSRFPVRLGCTSYASLQTRLSWDANMAVSATHSRCHMVYYPTYVSNRVHTLRSCFSKAFLPLNRLIEALKHLGLRSCAQCHVVLYCNGHTSWGLRIQ